MVEQEEIVEAGALAAESFSLASFDIDSLKLGNTVKMQIVIQEIAGLEAEAYRLELRHRIQVRLSNEQALKEIEETMVKVEESIDALKEEYRALKNSD